MERTSIQMFAVFFVDLLPIMMLFDLRGFGFGISLVWIEIVLHKLMQFFLGKLGVFYLAEFGAIKKQFAVFFKTCCIGWF